MQGSLAFTERAAAAGIQTRYLTAPGAGHPMLRHARRWHSLAAEAVARMLAAP